MGLDEMMVSHILPNILCDACLPDISQLPHDRRDSTPFRSPLSQLSVSQVQNCHLEQQARGIGSGPGPGPGIGPGPDPGPSIHQSNQAPGNLYSAVIQKNSKGKRAGRLTRPSITSDTFEALGTVSEAESRAQNSPTFVRVSNHAQQVLRLSVDKDSSHPLSVAAQNVPSFEKQLAKHSDGIFEWILAVRIPNDPKAQRGPSSETNNTGATRKGYFGCNLLPAPPSKENLILGAAGATGSHYLVVTPLADTEDVREVFRDPVTHPDMAAADTNAGPGTPVKVSPYGSIQGTSEVSPNSTMCTRGDDSSSESIVSRSPAYAVSRIEDSVEAMDLLEDELEAFDRVAHLDRYLPAEKYPSTIDSAVTPEHTATTSPSVRFVTPQQQRQYISQKPSSATLRMKPASQPRPTILRKSTSMTLDSYRQKTEEHAQTRITPKMSTMREEAKITSQRQTQSARATTASQSTVSTFELPGDTVARELKAKKEARLPSQRATQPTASSLRRSKSIQTPLRPAYELPGEAISRRKREEHQAQLKSQEEEDKRRREFKARPAPSAAAHSTAPRGTISSRARQSKTGSAENVPHMPSSSKGASMNMGTHSRAVLTATLSQSHSRGREVVGGGDSLQASRGTSTSTISAGDRRSPLSNDDVQMQKLRGQEIYRRDNSWADSRLREKYEREAQAKLAREEAAERSRQKSREWAAKQARKRVVRSGKD